MEELLQNEEIYVETLRKGIENYVKIFNDSPEELPRKLKGLKYHLFSNIEKIYEFHKNILLPKLKEVGYDLVKIADVFIELIIHNHFYCYVLYAINKKRSESLCRKHDDFFKVRCDLTHRMMIF
jgi:hypothetical protein